MKPDPLIFYLIEQEYTCYFTTENDMLHWSNKTIIGTVRTAYHKNNKKHKPITDFKMFTHSASDYQGIRTSVPERKKTVSFEYVLGLNNVTSKAQVLWHFLYTCSYKVRNHKGQFHKSWFKKGSTTLVKNKGPTQGQGCSFTVLFTSHTCLFNGYWIYF